MKRSLTLGIMGVALLAALVVPGTAQAGGGDGQPCDTFDEVPTFADVVYDISEEGVPLPLDVWVPPDPGPWPVVVLIHGAFGSGDKTAYDSWAEQICHQNFLVFNINYRLQCPPGHPPNPYVDPILCTGAVYPDEYEDVSAAMVWARDHADDYGGDPGVVATMGASGGASLAALQGARGLGPARPEAVISWSGMLKLWVFKNSSDPDRIQEATERYFGCPYSGPGSCPAIWVDGSPVTWVTPDDPPFYLANGTVEVISYNQTIAMDKKLDNRGVDHLTRIVPLPLHGRQYDSYFIPEVDMTVTEETFLWMHDHLDPLVGGGS